MNPERLENKPTGILKFVINSIPVSSKNEYSLSKNTGNLFLRANIKQYYNDAVRELARQKLGYADFKFPIEDNIACRFYFYVPDWRRDFVNLISAPSDALQKANIIKNDRQIKCIDGSKISIDKNKPRTEIEIKII